MTRFSLALAALLAPVALAIPKVPGYGYGGYSSSSELVDKPTSLSTAAPFPHPSGVPLSGGSLGPIGSSTAPFGFGNSTGVSGPTGTGSPIGTGSSSLSPSTVTVVPIPASSVEECGPATVTVTSANTVTVTVGAESVTSAEESSPISASSIISAPYPVGNGTTVGPTGTGTVGTVVSLPIESSSGLSVPVDTGLPTSTATLAPISGIPTSVSAHGYHHVSLHKQHSTSVVSVSTPGSSSSEVAPVIPASTPSVVVPVSTPGSSSSEVAPVIPASTSSVAPAEFYSVSTSSLTTAEAVSATTTSAPAELYSFSTSSSTTAETVSATTSSVPVYSATSTTSSSAVATPTTSPSTSGGNVVPRGLVYNTAALTDLFNKDTIGWCYNWDSQTGGDIPSNMNFVPMLWSTNEFHLPNWESNAKKAIANGATHILGFNEPDLGAQANMSPEEAAGAWDNMEKFAGQVKIGSPAVCNGGGEVGLSWLKKFMSACSSCTIDFIAIHWYGDANNFGIEALKQHIKDTQAMADGRPIWLTEFQPSGSTEQQAEFMSQMLPYLDDKSNGVERYAYFQVDGVLTSGGALSELGAKYVV